MSLYNEEDDPFDRLERAAEEIVTRQGWEQANRLGLLLVHALIGLFAGVLIIFNGTAVTFEIYGLWMRSLTGGLALVGGGVLLWGSSRNPRSFRTEAVGLALLGAWDVVMCGAFFVAFIEQDPTWSTIFTLPWREIPTGFGSRLYPIALYMGMLALIGVHLGTLRKLHKKRYENRQAKGYVE